MFGVKQFTAIINAPQAAILAVGAGIPHMAVGGEAGQTHRWDTRMRFTLCSDARVVDETAAAAFVGHLRMLLENPDFLLADGGSLSGDDRAAAWGY